MTTSQSSSVLASNVDSTASPLVATAVAYAGFWRRFVAAIVDGIAIGVVATIVAVVFGMLLGDTGAGIAGLINLVLPLLYFAFLESSSSQATLGKMLLGIKVTDMEGRRVSFLRALGRNLAKYISAIIFMIGYIMAAFTARKQALHDIIASCLVVKGKGEQSAL